jgi:eukaryotic-like serine/threonine-protein kinase
MTTLSATGQVLGGRYHLDRWVAGGVMGEVWQARDARMDRTVAVKVLRPAHINDSVALARFQYEAQLGARLDHPGIVKVHDVNATTGDEPPWLVQEFVHGETLAELIARSGPLDPALAIDLIAQAADAAHAAHTLGVIHRDLTPKNLMVTEDHVLKITDFGIARTDALPSLTMTGQVIGTPAYLSPEQVKGQNATARSDIYSLAVVLYECLAGVRPFSGSHPIEVARAHLDDDPPALPSFVPPDVAALVMATLAKDPAARPTAADEFARSLRALSKDASPAAAVEPMDHTHHTQHLPTVPPVRSQPRAGMIASEYVSRSGAAVRHGGQRALATSRQAWEHLSPEVQRAWTEARPEVLGLAHRAWRNRPATKVGLAGLAVLVLAIVAVLLLGDTA